MTTEHADSGNTGRWECICGANGPLGEWLLWGEPRDADEVAIAVARGLEFHYEQVARAAAAEQDAPTE